MSLNPNKNFYWFLYFIKERMEIFWNRTEGKLFPWTEDEILLKNKFTNCYRILDRTSQFLITDVIYDGKNYDELTILWRILLFKHFNKIETWKELQKRYDNFDIKFTKKSIDEVGEVISSIMDSGQTIYSNAYIMSGKSRETFTKRKHLKYFKLFKEIYLEKGYLCELLDSKSYKELFKKSVSLPYMADFLAMQYCTDWNYSEIFNFDENEFVAAGPGSKRGILKTFDLSSENSFEYVIAYVQENYFDLCKKFSVDFDLTARLIDGRTLSCMDIQNCFCETDKFLREKLPELNGKKKRIKQKYQFKSNKKDIDYQFPPKWKIKNIKSKSCQKKDFSYSFDLF